MEYRWPGRNIHFDGDSIRLTRVLSQHLDSNLDECVIVALGVNRANEQLIAKLRIEVNPGHATGADDSDSGSEVDDSGREVAKRRFEDEWAALKELEGSGHTPHLLVCGAIEQDRSMPYPGGYFRALIMSKIPGQNVGDILLDLEEDERVAIEAQLAEVLDYLADLGGAIPKKKAEKIGPESGIVKAFMISSEYSRRSQR